MKWQSIYVTIRLGRNIRKNINEIIKETFSSLKDVVLRDELISKIKLDNSKYVRDQLVGIQSLTKKYSTSYWDDILRNVNLYSLKCSILEANLLAAKQRRKA